MKNMKSFGVKKQHLNLSKIDIILEELSIKGYAVVKDVLSKVETKKLRDKIDEVYEVQKNEIGEGNLDLIKERDLVRLPLAYDPFFLEIVSNSLIIKIMKSIFGDYFILNLQNAIINRPNENHHQHSWHRDLPYQDFVTTEPLAINAMYCVDPFNEDTGATTLIPFSHKLTEMPSEEYMNLNKVQAEANEGDVIIFDSMIFHCAGYNSSSTIRRGVNNMYSIPILKQQFDIPKILKENAVKDNDTKRMLGFDNESFDSISSWRYSKIEKIKE